jgi:hypothetical protein
MTSLALVTAAVTSTGPSGSTAETDRHRRTNRHAGKYARSVVDGGSLSDLTCTRCDPSHVLAVIPKKAAMSSPRFPAPILCAKIKS